MRILGAIRASGDRARGDSNMSDNNGEEASKASKYKPEPGKRKWLNSAQQAYCDMRCAGSSPEIASMQAYPHLSPSARAQSITRLENHRLIRERVAEMEQARRERLLHDANQLRGHVISRLVHESLDKDSRAQDRIAALKLIGNLAIVGAFAAESAKPQAETQDPAKLRAEIAKQFKRLGLDSRVIDIELPSKGSAISIQDADSSASDDRPAQPEEPGETPPTGTPQEGSGDPRL